MTLRYTVYTMYTHIVSPVSLASLVCFGLVIVIDCSFPSQLYYEPLFIDLRLKLFGKFSTLWYLSIWSQHQYPYWRTNLSVSIHLHQYRMLQQLCLSISESNSTYLMLPLTISSWPSWHLVLFWSETPNDANQSIYPPQLQTGESVNSN